jgi:hypothetical protein
MFTGIHTTEAQSVLQTKLESRLTHGREVAAKALTDLYQQGQALNDHLVPVRGLSYHNDNDTGRVQMLFSSGDAISAGSMHTNAVQQLADKLGLPGRYMKQLVEGDEWMRPRCAQPPGLDRQRNTGEPPGAPCG